MATYYWVYTGTINTNWTSSSNWSLSSGGAGGAGVPTAADDVVFDNNSGHASSIQTILFQTTSVCRSFTITSRTRGALYFSDVNYLTIYGSVSFNAASNATFAGGNSYFRFAATSGSWTISSGINLPKLIFDGVGGSWAFASNITCYGATGSPQYKNIDVVNGALSFAGYSVTAQQLTSNYTNTRSINFGSSTVTLRGLTPVDIDVTSLSMSWTTGMIVVNGAGSPSTSEITFNIAGANWPPVSVARTDVDSSFAISGTGSVAGLTIASPASDGYTNCRFTSDVTIAGAFNCTGASPTRRIFVQNDGTSAAAIVTASSAVMSYVDFRKIQGAGAASWTGSSLGDGGWNTNISFPAAKTVYWNKPAGGNWTDNAWATSSGGAPGVSNFPLLQDTAVINNAGINSAATIALGNWPRLGSVNTLSVTPSNACNITTTRTSIFLHGDWQIGSSAGLGGTPQLDFVGEGSKLLQSGYFAGTLNVSSGSTLSMSGPINVGALDVYGTFSSNSYDVTSSRLTAYSSFTSAVLNMGSGTWTMTAYSGTVWNVPIGVTLSAGTSNIVLYGGGGITFAGGSKTYNNVTLASGSNAITGNNTFNTISSSSGTTSVTFASGSTTTVSNFNISGGSSRITLTASSTSSFALSKPSGTVEVVNLAISKSQATGGATWVAVNSLNAGSNSGWIFRSTASFFAFF